MAASSVFEKIPNTTLRERIANRIRDAVLDGSLKPGDRLVERSLAVQFGASSTAVREALIQLETEGFVDKKPNFVTRVIRLSLADVEKIFAVRSVLEGYAVEEAARLVTPEQVRGLEEAYLEIVDAARNGDSRLFVEKDSRWHARVWAASGNEHLAEALRRLCLPLFAFSAIRLRAASTLDLLADAHSHLPLLGAIRSGDPAGGRSALRAALDVWLQELREWVFGDASSSSGVVGP